MQNIHLGIDFGGSGIKGCLVDTSQGVFTTERHRIETPSPASPEKVTQIFKDIINHFDYSGDVGVAFPAAVQNGLVRTASNIDKSWIGQNAATLIEESTSNRASVVNDADAAALAEVRFGHGKDIAGTVLMITIGSGLGTAIFTDGKLLANTELGHVYYKNKIAEKWASDATRKEEDLSWKKWAKRFNEYLHYMEKLFYPELIILGGGASKKFEKYSEYLKDVETEVVPAYLQNHAGIIGAAIRAAEQH
ncbi:MAG: ROK family protein [Bacteroidales bacterium]|nr:ROK family protein [Bacteroidales bacterium]MCF8338987.1 ROK family protein [Bacteroidales bacterium]